MKLLIDLGSFEDALKAIDGGIVDIGHSLSFEKAYCIYRIGRLEDALKALSSVEAERAAAALQLEAQIQYRLGNYSKSIEIYRKLLDDYNEDSVEMKTNMVAAYAAAGFGEETVEGLKKSLAISPEDGFELAFNLACGTLAIGNVSDAKTQLQISRRVGEEMLYEEGLEEEDVEAELAPISAQLAYISALGEDLNDAAENFRDLIVLEGRDLLTGIVAASNLAAILLRQKPNDKKAGNEGLKAVEQFLERSGGYLKVKATIEGRIGKSHCEKILSIYAAAALAAGKVDIARESIRCIERYNKGSLTGAVLLSALLAQENKFKESCGVIDNALKSLQVDKEHWPVVQALLMRTQLAAKIGDIRKAIECLDALPTNFGKRPAVQATQMSFFELENDYEVAFAALQKILGDVVNDEQGARWVLSHLAKLEVSHGNLEAASEHLQNLTANHKTSLEDPVILRMYPRLLAMTSPEKSSNLLENLGQVPNISGSELDALEAAGGVSVARVSTLEMPSANLTEKKLQNEEPQGELTKDRKRKRKPRYPKGFDPDRPGPPPDPERWIPKWQRSTYKKKRKGKDKDVIKGAQGAGRVDAGLDRSIASTNQGSAPSKHVSNKKKKKGKGRK